MDNSELDKTFAGNDDSVLDMDMIMASESKWARLASENPLVAHIELEADECSFGRAKSCDIKLDDKRISSVHCKLYRNREPGETDYRFYLEDKSTNGTFVNRKKIGKGNTVSVVHGNEIALTANINPDDEKRLVYTFQDWDKIRRDRAEELRREQKEKEEREAEEPGNTQVLDETDDAITAGNTDTDVPMNLTTTPSKLTRNGTEIVLDSPNVITASPITRKKTSSDSKINAAGSSVSSSPAKQSISPAGSFSTTTTTTTNTTADSNDTPKTVRKNTSVLKRKSSDLNDGKSGDANNSSSDNIEIKKTKVEHDSMEENLICGICQEIIHKCLTLIPCMHNFCMCCYGDWRQNSPICPQCRSNVKSGQKNHAINNLIESYLKSNPTKKRDPEETKEMDARSKITDDMLQKGVLNKIKQNYYDDDDEYDDDDDDEYDGSDDDDEYNNNYGAVALPLNKCFFCANPTPDGFKCADPNPVHQTCAGCHQRFPLRTPAPYKDKCELCSKPYCNNVRACPSALFTGMHNMVDQHINDIPHNSLGGNQFEIKILNDYMVQHNKTVDGLYHEVLADIDSGKIPTATIKTINGTAPKSDLWTCVVCTRHVFSQGLFTYRKNIPKEDLPEYAQVRDNCYYGKNCRTQFNKMDHAKKLNHVCEQSKFN